MRIRQLATAVAGSLCAASFLAPVAASAQEPYQIKVTSKNPDVQYFQGFQFDKVTVVGPNKARATKLTKKVKAYVMQPVNFYRSPSKKTKDYLKRARPAGFAAGVAPTSNCRTGYVCVSQGTVFTTQLLASSVTSIQARAWSTRTTKKAALRQFVSAKDLPAFTERVKSAIRQAPCYYGFGIDLPAKYSSFPNWVPLNSGIGVWFPEYQFGCQIMELRVSWP